jgi:hypothetical protein
MTTTTTDELPTAPTAAGSASEASSLERALMSIPMSQRLRAAADVAAELNALQGFHDPQRAAVSPAFLREEAERMEADQVHPD